jgi:hypothetical protein
MILDSEKIILTFADIVAIEERHGPLYQLLEKMEVGQINVSALIDLVLDILSKNNIHTTSDELLQQPVARFLENIILITLEKIEGIQAPLSMKDLTP